MKPGDTIPCVCRLCQCKYSWRKGEVVSEVLTCPSCGFSESLNDLMIRMYPIAASTQYKQTTDRFEDTESVINDKPAQHKDEGKPKLQLIDSYFVEQMGLVLDFGSKKYDPWNWTKGIHYTRLIGSTLRHVFAFSKGQDNDPESGLPHLAHAACCLMMLLGMTQRKPEFDDRNKTEDK